MAGSLLVVVGGSEAGIGMSSSERCESSSNRLGGLNGDGFPRVAASVGRCIRFLFLTIFQGWFVGISDSEAEGSSDR